MISRRWPLAACALTVLAALAGGCSKDKGTAPTSDLDAISISPSNVVLSTAGLRYSSDVQAIFSSRCALGGCHASASRAGGLALASYDGVAAGGSLSGAVVIAGSPGTSELIRRVETTNTGERMPLGGPELPAGEKEILRRWVERALVQFRATGHAGDDTVSVSPTWTATAGGRIASNGLFTADTDEANVIVTASARGTDASTNVTIGP